MHTFLFELGIEELPDSVILPAINSLKTSLEKTLAEEGIEYQEIWADSTPRRLVVSVNGLPARQADVEVCKTGPSVNIALDANQELSKAGEGFLRKSGGTKDDMFIQNTEKGDFIAVKFVQKGKNCEDILQAWIISAIPAIPLPKKMIWKNKNLAFSRPIRWILALWDAQLIELSYLGIDSGRISYPNRYLGLDKKLIVNHAEEYEDLLAQHMVIVSRERRRAKILEQFSGLFPDSLYKVKDDERLLDTVCNLVEHPYAVVGEFDPGFLSLPEKIINSTISQNQKYFSVYDSNDRLTNRFVFISNGDPACSNIIKNGNEKVVAARLQDALWFFKEDSKQGLDAFIPHLEEVVFQSRLGTLADKTARLHQLTEYLSKALSLNEDERQKSLRTAGLCKADLVSLMLGEKEFTRLQGYMGMQYALVGGEDPLVAQGIYEHYMPRGSNDSLPSTLCGAICAVADKLDTVCGIIGVGQMPTGSADPFALRRAAGGIVQIVAARGWNIDLELLIDYAFEVLGQNIELENDSREKVKNFFAQRVNWLLKEMGISYDVVASVMHAGFSHLPHLIARARALDELRQDEDFVKLVIGFKRVSNIIAGTSDFVALDHDIFENEAERNLYNALGDLSGKVDKALQAMDYSVALTNLVSFGTVIDKFFDDVLVNCEDTRMRNNRYALLGAIRREFIKVADLSLIVVESDLTGE